VFFASLTNNGRPQWPLAVVFELKAEPFRRVYELQPQRIGSNRELLCVSALVLLKWFGMCRPGLSDRLHAMQVSPVYLSAAVKQSRCDPPPLCPPMVIYPIPSAQAQNPPQIGDRLCSMQRMGAWQVHFCKRRFSNRMTACIITQSPALLF
jgi:hypothetical protein